MGSDKKQQKSGSGPIFVRRAHTVITGTSRNISTVDFEIINTTNFAGLTITPSLDGMITYNALAGVTTLLDSGVLEMDATINAQADQAAAEFTLVPEFNEQGAGWVPGVPRKEVLTAIKPSQLSFHGTKHFFKGDQIRFCVKAASGNVLFKTETIDPGGPLESVLPAAIIYLKLTREVPGISI
jgi:hypothetical protein